MVGYLYAMKQGAEYIADIDDDNIPLPNWPNLPDSNARLDTLSGVKFVNIYKNYTKEFIWPRGFPLNQILATDKPSISSSSHDVAIWQFLANEDPDVDAIYRLTNNKQITFNDKAHLVLDEGSVCPFNSQNTVFRKDVFPLLYLPSFVTFRFTDILRGLVAQPLLWRAGSRLGFGPPTVVQKRNLHDYMEDFESEIPVYIHSEKVVDIAVASLKNSRSKTITSQLLSIYESLRAEEIVKDYEINLLKTWIEDLNTLFGKTA